MTKNTYSPTTWWPGAYGFCICTPKPPNILPPAYRPGNMPPPSAYRPGNMPPPPGLPLRAKIR